LSPGLRHVGNQYFRQLRPHFGQVFRELARQRECKIEEGHLKACPATVGRFGSAMSGNSPILQESFASARLRPPGCGASGQERRRFFGFCFWVTAFTLAAVKHGIEII